MKTIEPDDVKFDRWYRFGEHHVQCTGRDTNFVTLLVPVGAVRDLKLTKSDRKPGLDGIEG